MKVLLLSWEVAPYASTGKLGSVTGALSTALAESGVDLRVAMPLYSRVRTAASVSVRVSDRVVDGRVETDGSVHR